MLMIESDTEKISYMVNAAMKAMQHAYVPRCQFPVGACIATDQGGFFSGCNWENTAMPLSQCAETSAIGTMIAHGHRLIADIVIVAAKQNGCMPCGACRQRIFEFSNTETGIHICSSDGHIINTYSISNLLPCPFSKPNAALNN